MLKEGKVSISYHIHLDIDLIKRYEILAHEQGITISELFENMFALYCNEPAPVVKKMVDSYELIKGIVGTGAISYEKTAAALTNYYKSCDYKTCASMATKCINMAKDAGKIIQDGKMLYISKGNE